MTICQKIISRLKLTWPANVLWAAGGGPPTLSIFAGQVDLVSFVYDGINDKYYAAVSLGY